MKKISRLMSIIAFFLFGFSLPTGFSEARYWILFAAFVLLAASNIVYMIYVSRDLIETKTVYRLMEEISGDSNG